MNGLHPPSEALAGASEGVLAKLTSLYAGAGPGSLGLKHIADDLGLQREVRKPRRKIRCAAQQAGHSRVSDVQPCGASTAPETPAALCCSVMIVGNHSAGKSSFINWYIGERVVKTGVAIETRGFILCTSGRCGAVCHTRAGTASCGPHSSRAAQDAYTSVSCLNLRVVRFSGAHTETHTHAAGGSATPSSQHGAWPHAHACEVPAGSLLYPNSQPRCRYVCVHTGSVRHSLVMPPSDTLTTWRALTALMDCWPTCSQVWTAAARCRHASASNVPANTDVTHRASSCSCCSCQSP